jgi:hypothetical protein
VRERSIFENLQLFTHVFFLFYFDFDFSSFALMTLFSLYKRLSEL